MTAPRRALIGEKVTLLDGRVGKISGINSNGVASIVINGAVVTVDQDAIIFDGGYRERSKVGS